MSEPKKNLGAGFWGTVVLLVVLVAYPLSFGPWCRFNRAGPGEIKASAYVWPYYPMFWLMDNGQAPIKSAIRSYVIWCVS